MVADNIMDSIKLDRNQVRRNRVVTEPIKIPKTCPRLPDEVFVDLMAYISYVLISKPGFRVIKIAQREVVSRLLLPLCNLIYIFRLRGSELRALRLTTVRETFPCEE